MKPKEQSINEAYKRVEKAVKKINEDWILGIQCEEIETCLNKTTARELMSL